MINSFAPISAPFAPPSIAVSACLLGEKVRYDGKDKNQSQDLNDIQKYCRVKPICPEVAAGLGVPRPPVQLVQTASGTEAIGVKQKQLNVTSQLQAQAKVLGGLVVEGFILKSRSPSCGINTTPIFNTQGQQQALASGIIAQHLQGLGFLLIDEIQLQNPAVRKAFIVAALLLADWQQSQVDAQTFLAHHQLSKLACGKLNVEQIIKQQFQNRIKG